MNILQCQYKSKNQESTTLNHKYYIVKPLDTFDSLSKKLNIPKTTLKKLAGTSHLFIGQKIRVDNFTAQVNNSQQL